MTGEKKASLISEERSLESAFLNRTVKLSCFLPVDIKRPENLEFLLVNDGQDMETLGLEAMLDELIQTRAIRPIVSVAMHAGADRKMEYGTAAQADYMGRGAKAGAYSRFVMEELLPFIRNQYALPLSAGKSFAGFSLGGLSALDIVWNHPGEFSRVGVFSGSLWWRTRALDDGYVEATDRIMHAQIREGKPVPGLRFFFETGALDETMDRNNNGIIDAIDDTLDLIALLEEKGYRRPEDIEYLQLDDGRHDVATWARAMPVFLKWAFGA
jgi:enterochelin esterase-like enzyme